MGCPRAIPEPFGFTLPAGRFNAHKRHQIVSSCLSKQDAFTRFHAAVASLTPEVFPVVTHSAFALCDDKRTLV
jgi:hypothetical protein